MAFDGLVTYAICKELNSNIIGSRIEKIHMPTKNEIIFITHSNNEKLKLLISIDPSNARVHFTWGQKENPTKAPSFCMVLRKYLQGSKILSINQNGLDRVIIINFENINELGDKVTYNLYIELMGKYSNIILVNEKNKILDSIKHVDFTMSSVREVLPARDYIIPTNLGKISFLELSEDEFCKIILDIKNNEFYSYETMSKIISNTFVGFSKTFIDTIISKLDLKENLTYDQAKNIYKEILLILSNISNNNISLKLYENDYHFDLNFINNEFLDTKDQISNNIEKKYHNSIFLDGFYLKKELDNSIKTAKFNLLKDVNSFKNKYLKNLSRVNDIISEKENMSKYKLYGELIQANIYRISPGINKISVENYYDNNNLIEIPLNTSISPAMNSGAYFKKYTKIKNAISMAEKQKEDYINNINYLDNVSYLIDSSSSIEEIEAIKQELTLAGYKNYWSIKRKYFDEQKLQPIEYVVDGVKIKVGRNNIQNDKLTLKEAHKNYTWLHVKDFHGSHVIIESDNVSDNILYSAAKLAVKHSSANASSKVSVDYTKVRFVHKPSGAKPGKVVYTDYKTIII